MKNAMNVPFSYLGRQFDNVDDILEDVKQLVKSGKFTLGKAVQEFERKFAHEINADHAIGVGSGTDALFLSLKALGVESGDEVMTAVNTFVATAGAIETAGAKLVFVDCNEKYVIDENQIEQAITSKTKVLMPVHYSGQPANMPKIMEIAEKHQLHVVEDACQAIGAAIGGQNCGTFGETAGFSLHPLKNLNVWGDAGVIVTHSEEIRDRLRLLRNHGMLNRDEYAFYAYNSRLDALQAVVGNRLIGETASATETRIRNAHRYDEAFRDLSESMTIPPRSTDERHSYHLYMLLVKDRDRLNAYLQQNGIESKIHYPIPLHLQPASQPLGYRNGDFPVAEQQAQALITLPVHSHLTEDELDYTIEQVWRFYKNGN